MADAQVVKEEADTAPNVAPGAAKGTQSPKQGFKALEEGDLTSPTAARLLLEENDRLKSEIAELKSFRDRFHELDKRCAVLEEKTRVARAFEILSSAALAIGAALIGYARYLWDSPPSGYWALALGGVLVVGGLVAKAVKR